MELIKTMLGGPNIKVRILAMNDRICPWDPQGNRSTFEKIIILKIRMKDSISGYTKLKLEYPNNEFAKGLGPTILSILSIT